VLAPLNALDVNALLHHLPQRAHLAQLLNMLHCQGDRAVHLSLGGKPAQAKADGGMRHILFHTQRPQHIAGLQAGTRACTATAYSQILHIDSQR